MRQFFRREEGSVAIFAAILLPMLLGVAAFAVDLSNLYYNKSKIQQAADAAALGGVLSLPNTTAVTSTALSLVAENAPADFGTLSTAQDVAVGNWDPSTRTFTASSTNQNAVQVMTHRTAANGNPILTYFGRFVGAQQLAANATAVAVRFGGACVRVLDPSASGAFTDGGSGQIDMNCALQVNSSSGTAAQAKGSSSISTQLTCITGGYSGKGWTPTPKTGCQPLADPLASIPEPTAPSCSVNNPSVSSGTLASNCTYTGTVSLSGSVNLQSGLYYFKNATIKVTASTSISGSGVMLFLDAGSTMNLGGSGTISLSAGTSGTYAGILIFQSRSTPSNHALTIGGSGTMSLDGTLYAPSATLNMSGNSTNASATKVGYAIADQLSLGGSSSFTFNAFPTSYAIPRTLRVHTGLVH